MYWLISANPKYYKCFDAFNDNCFVDWHQIGNYSVGDTVFIYTTKPYQMITFETIVEKVDISTEQSIKDTKGENLTIGEQLAEQYSFEMDFEDFPFGNDDVKQMATELVEDRIAEYYNKLVGVKNRNASSKELEKIIKQKGLNITTIKNEVEKIKNDVMDMSEEEIIETYRSTELSEMFRQDVKYRVDLQRNLQQKADRVKEALAGKKKAYEKLVELYPDLGFTSDKEWHIPTKENRVLKVIVQN